MNNLDKLNAIIDLATELRAEFPPDLPPPPDVEHVTTAEGLRLALMKGGTIVIAPGVYGGNFGVTAPAEIREEHPGTVTLRPTDQFKPTLEVQASDVSITGLTIRNGAPDRECVLVGSHTETDASKQPHRVTLIGLKIHAHPEGGRRGLSLHGSDITVRSADIRGFWFRGQDAQGIWINNGSGPYTIEDSHIEGSGENILVGGDRLRIGQNPADITIRRNNLFKPQEWRQHKGSVKNSFELKAGLRVLFEDNVIDGCWRDAQSGTPIVLTPRNQSGLDAFTQVDEVTIRRNRVVNCSDLYAVNILGSDNLAPSQPMHSLIIKGNLFADSPRGFLIDRGAGLTVIVGHNTFAGIENTFLQFSGPPMARLEFFSNVARSGAYGIQSSGGVGAAALGPHVLASLFEGNVIEQSVARTIKYPAGNHIVPPGQLAVLLDADLRMLDGSAGW